MYIYGERHVLFPALSSPSTINLHSFDQIIIFDLSLQLQTTLLSTPPNKLSLPINQTTNFQLSKCSSPLSSLLLPPWLALSLLASKSTSCSALQFNILTRCKGPSLSMLAPAAALPSPLVLPLPQLPPLALSLHQPALAPQLPTPLAPLP